MSVARHHHVHAGSLLQVGVEVKTKNHLFRILAHSIIHLRRIVSGLKAHLVKIRIELLGYLATHMVEHHHEKTARTTGGIEHTAVLVGVEHLHHTFDDIAWCEKLPGFLLQCIAHNSFVCRALHIHRGIEE